MAKAEKSIRELNIYERFQTLKVEVAKSIKGKSGSNDYKGFNYLELTDFLPQLNELLLEYGLFAKMETVLSIDKETGVTTDMMQLRVQNVDNPQEGLQWLTPIKSAVVQGATEIQNFGASITYTRRYIWVLALDIAVPDVIDSQVGSGKLVEGKQVIKATDKQKQVISNLDPAVLDELLKRTGKGSMDDLTVDEASRIIKWMKGQKNGTGNG